MLGFQRIYDLSTLSLKLLNDQLESMWHKLMGGIDIKDTSSAMQKVIDSKAEAEAVDELTGQVSKFTTELTQTAKEIMLSATNEVTDGLVDRIERNEAAISVQAHEISLKAGNYEVSALGNRVANAESQLVVQADRISSMVTAGNFNSLIQQNADSVRLAVGSIGGNNLLRNGTAAFGMSGWGYTTGVSADYDERYSWFRIDGAFGYTRMMNQVCTVTGVRAVHMVGVEISGVGISLGTGNAFAGITAEVETPVGVATIYSECLANGNTDWKRVGILIDPAALGVASVSRINVVPVVRNASGSVRYRFIKLEEGASMTAWSPNGNELSSSAISVFDDQVVIDTPNLAIRLRDGYGDVAMEMSANAYGFQNMFVAGNLYLGGKRLRLPGGQYHLWVRGDAVGAYGVFSNTEPSSGNYQERCFCELQDAIDYIPKWCDGEVTVHVYGNSTLFYTSFNISGFHGMGKITVVPWGSRPYIRGIQVSNNSFRVNLQTLDIVPSASGCAFWVSCASVWCVGVRVFHLNKALVNNICFGAAAGSSLSLSGCEAYKACFGCVGDEMARVSIVDCSGNNLSVGTHAQNGSFITQHGTTFAGDTQYSEAQGGKVLLVGTAKVGTSAPPMVGIAENVASFSCALSASYLVGKGWVGANDWIYQNGDGGDYYGLFWFPSSLRSTLSGKSISRVRLTLRRRESGGKSTYMPVTLWGFSNSGTGSVPVPVYNYNKIGVWSWGETKTVTLALKTMQDLRDGVINGFGLRSSDGDYLIMDGVSGVRPSIEVCYY